jgi:phospholipid transport system transporter-binding protein
VNESPARVESVGDRWNVSGGLTMDTAASVLELSREMALPASGVIELQSVETVDSAGVAVLLAWKRRAISEKIPIVFEGAPATLTTLAELYGVEELLAEPAA